MHLGTTRFCVPDQIIIVCRLLSRIYFCSGLPSLRSYVALHTYKQYLAKQRFRAVYCTWAVSDSLHPISQVRHVTNYARPFYMKTFIGFSNQQQMCGTWGRVNAWWVCVIFICFIHSREQGYLLVDTKRAVTLEKGWVIYLFRQALWYQNAVDDGWIPSVCDVQVALLAPSLDRLQLPAQVRPCLF